MSNFGRFLPGVSQIPEGLEAGLSQLRLSVCLLCTIWAETSLLSYPVLTVWPFQDSVKYLDIDFPYAKHTQSIPLTTDEANVSVRSCQRGTRDLTSIRRVDLLKHSGCIRHWHSLCLTLWNTSSDRRSARVYQNFGPDRYFWTPNPVVIHWQWLLLCSMQPCRQKGFGVVETRERCSPVQLGAAAPPKDSAHMDPAMDSECITN
jgi:hypothetical protein